MAAVKAYDPIKSIEGMFNGCVTRIAQVLKDPSNFGASTPTILAECSKKFLDALDDCEIQVLDAKWYLEHQLALNKAKREAKAREEIAATAKRKHEEIKDEEEKVPVQEETKRQKVESPDQQKPQDKPLVSSGFMPTDTKDRPEAPLAAADQVLKTPSPKSEPARKSPSPKAPSPKLPEPSQPTEQPPLQTPTLDDFPRITSAEPTPANTADDFNFTSMFGEPSATQDDPSAGDEMNFDLNLDFPDSTTPGGAASAGNLGAGLGDGGLGSIEMARADTQQSKFSAAGSDLNSLLPGLESYANQPDPTDPANANNPAPSMNFDLPNLGPNEFDAFLDANNFEGGGGGGGGGARGGGNLNPDGAADLGDLGMGDDLNIEGMDSMENLDFDSMFE